MDTNCHLHDVTEGKGRPSILPRRGVTRPTLAVSPPGRDSRFSCGQRLSKYRMYLARTAWAEMSAAARISPESLLSLFRDRRSIRRYRPDPVPDEMVQEIL